MAHHSQPCTDSRRKDDTAILIFLMPGTWMFYQAMTAIEVVLQLLAVWYAWRWPGALATACYVTQQEHA